MRRPIGRGRRGLTAAGQAAYKAARSKRMDAMLEVGEQVTVACANCHEPYRDFDDQSRRCTPVDGKPAE